MTGLTSICVEERSNDLRPALAPFPPIKITLNVTRTPDGTRDLLVDAAGAVHAVDVDQSSGRISVLVPNPRAADIMFPDHSRVFSARSWGVKVDLPALMGRLM